MSILGKNIKAIKDFLDSRDLLTEGELAALSQDTREGVRRLYNQYCRKLALEEQENLRLDKMLTYEKDARRKGHKVIAGVDEVGRGPLAGAVVAAAVILPEDIRIKGLDDSKKLTPLKRDSLYEEIMDKALCWSVGIASVEEIDTLNIYRASLQSMKRAVEGLAKCPEYLLVDAVQVPEVTMPQLPIIKGDGLSLSIAAASVIAKVTRDRMMDELDKTYPQYGFARHKGYGTREHIEAIRKHGPCPLHRRSFMTNLVTGAKEEAVRENNLKNFQESFW